MKIKEVCERTGLTDRTIRFYVEKGLLRVEENRINGRINREYSEEDVELLKDISKLRKAQFSIQDILDMQSSEKDINQIVSKHCEKIEEEYYFDEILMKELKQIYVNQNMSWRMVAQNLFCDTDEIQNSICFARFEEPVVEEERKSVKWYLKKWSIIILCIISLLMVIISGINRWYGQKVTQTYFSIHDVMIHEKWVDEDGTPYVKITSNPVEGVGYDSYFFDEKKIKVETFEQYDALIPGTVTYMYANLVIDVPYLEAKQNGWLKEGKFLIAEKVLENEEYLEKYGILVRIVYENYAAPLN